MTYYLLSGSTAASASSFAPVCLPDVIPVTVVARSATGSTAPAALSATGGNAPTEQERANALTGAAATASPASSSPTAMPSPTPSELVEAQADMDLLCRRLAVHRLEATEATPEEGAQPTPLRQLEGGTVPTPVEAAEPTPSASSDPLPGTLRPVAVPQYRGPHSELAGYAQTQVAYGAGYFHGPRAIAHAIAQVLGSSKLISNHYAHYGL